MNHKILLPVLIAFFISGQFVYSQAPGGGAPAGGPAGGGIPPPDFPSYSVTPREDLDNYNLSTKQKSTFEGNRENVSSFGKTPVQQNIDEVNSEIQKLEEQRNIRGDAQPDQTGDTADFDEQNIGASDEDSYVQPRGENSLYRWVDKEGVIHVTDDISSIPAEYRDQAYKGK